ncbi:hypothetical protein BJ508DRAFT_324160 [Ascobolus immersus RN42]|uniref:DNA recombination and repair protein Rad51-like C-terminal domain-containing protein n=1 Tax=Ascobolus immersus RN42 TaxID=1160509 RepID=A0A3N4IHZ5_ASCIM|nr:hypothetical protein BJ508DRAFT_324160 [Ascobolus immersus RN42]
MTTTIPLPTPILGNSLYRQQLAAFKQVSLSKPFVPRPNPPGTITVLVSSSSTLRTQIALRQLLSILTADRHKTASYIQTIPSAPFPPPFPEDTPGEQLDRIILERAFDVDGVIECIREAQARDSFLVIDTITHPLRAEFLRDTEGGNQLLENVLTVLREGKGEAMILNDTAPSKQQDSNSDHQYHVPKSKLEENEALRSALGAGLYGESDLMLWATKRKSGDSVVEVLIDRYGPREGTIQDVES